MLEEAEIQREIAGDRTHRKSDEQLAHPMTFAEVMKRGRGRPPVETPKEHVSVRLDADVLQKLKGGRARLAELDLRRGPPKGAWLVRSMRC